MVEIERDDGDQHQHRPREGEEEELDRRVDAPVASPHPDEEIHRNEDQLPEDVEQEEVEREKDPHHPDLEEKHEDHELLHVLLDRFVGGQDGDRHQERGEQEKPQGDAVHPHVVADPELRDPGDLLDELHRSRRPVEPDRHGQGKEELRERDGEGHVLLQSVVFLRQEDEQKGAGDGEEDQRGKQVRHQGLRHFGHRHTLRLSPISMLYGQKRNPTRITAPRSRVKA
jgi:hypothetical protein